MTRHVSFDRFERLVHEAVDSEDRERLNRLVLGRQERLVVLQGMLQGMLDQLEDELETIGWSKACFQPEPRARRKKAVK
jgi:hypothetical protein